MPGEIKVYILTNSPFGVAPVHLQALLGQAKISVVAVILSERSSLNKRSVYFKKRIAKVRKIGVLGALNGIRMRRWFDEDMRAYLPSVSLAELCAAHAIPLHRMKVTNSPETAELIKSLDADVGLSLGNGYIGKRIFSITRYGMLNVHHELLPDYQNASSIVWQLYNRSSQTGYTIHKIDSRIDGGDILHSEVMPILFESGIGSTVAVTFAAVVKASAKGLALVLADFENYWRRARKQCGGCSYTTPTIWQYMRMYRNYRLLKRGG